MIKGKEQLMETLITDFFIEEGFAQVGFLNHKDAKFEDWISEWLQKGYHADMSWMLKYKSIRLNPCSMVDFGKSIIIASYPYATKMPEKWERENPISNYAWGEDYHVFLRKKLKKILQKLETNIQGFKGRFFVDTAPIPEKIIAARCGLGWIGKNSLLINRKFGSTVFLGGIVSNLDLPSTSVSKHLCGKCDKCIQACPTRAVLSDAVIDSSRCISYLTIEKRGTFTPFEEKQVGYHLFGCDICQQVCPFNRKPVAMEDSAFSCADKWLTIDMEELATLSKERFDELKINSPLKRAKLDGIRRNARAVLKNKKRGKED